MCTDLGWQGVLHFSRSLSSSNHVTCDVLLVIIAYVTEWFLVGHHCFRLCEPAMSCHCDHFLKFFLIFFFFFGGGGLFYPSDCFNRWNFLILTLYLHIPSLIVLIDLKFTTHTTMIWKCAKYFFMKFKYQNWEGVVGCRGVVHMYLYHQTTF